MAQPVSFRWDDEFVERIDRARGLVPRSAWVRSAIEVAMAVGEASKEAKPADPSPSVPKPAPATVPPIPGVVRASELPKQRRTAMTASEARIERARRLAWGDQ